MLLVPILNGRANAAASASNFVGSPATCGVIGIARVVADTPEVKADTLPESSTACTL
ncbi:hypothetical protein D3C86_2088170 [compost metagenome]